MATRWAGLERAEAEEPPDIITDGLHWQGADSATYYKVIEASR